MTESEDVVSTVRVSKRVIDYRMRQLENELRYCLMIIETNLDCKSDLRIEYAKSLLPTIQANEPIRRTAKIAFD